MKTGSESGQCELEDIAQFTLHHFEQRKDAGKAAAQGLERGQALAGAKFADGWNGPICLCRSSHGFSISSVGCLEKIWGEFFAAAERVSGFGISRIDSKS